MFEYQVDLTVRDTKARKSMKRRYKITTPFQLSFDRRNMGQAEAVQVAGASILDHFTSESKAIDWSGRPGSGSIPPQTTVEWVGDTDVMLDEAQVPPPTPVDRGAHE